MPEESDSSSKSATERPGNAIPFVTLVLALGGWSLGFYALQASGPDAVAEGVRCLTFFGGLIAAALLGSVLGIFLQRLVWRRSKRKKSG